MNDINLAPSFPNIYYPNGHSKFFAIGLQGHNDRKILEGIINIIGQDGSGLLNVKWIESIETPIYNDPTTWKYKFRDVGKLVYTLNEFITTRKKYHEMGEFGDANAFYLMSNISNSCNLLVDEWDLELAIISSDDQFAKSVIDFIILQNGLPELNVFRYVQDYVYLNPKCKNAFLKLVKINFSG